MESENGEIIDLIKELTYPKYREIKDLIYKPGTFFVTKIVQIILGSFILMFLITVAIFKFTVRRLKIMKRLNW